MSRRAPGGESSFSLAHDAPDSRFPLRQMNAGVEAPGGGGKGQFEFGANAAVRSGSSNAFANGASQNCGNVITDRSSTRLYAPPGGRSSISFGDDGGGAGHRFETSAQAAGGGHRERHEPRQYAPPASGDAYAHGGNAATRKNSSNAYANGANQNCGNVITDRSSTRLHAPPGGGSSWSIGWAGEAAAPAPRASAPAARGGYQQDRGGGYQEDRGGGYQPAPYREPRADDYAYGANARKGSNAFANGANQNCGNVITDRSSTRLHAPPGGHSSITFG